MNKTESHPRKWLGQVANHNKFILLFRVTGGASSPGYHISTV